MLFFFVLFVQDSHLQHRISRSCIALSRVLPRCFGVCSIVSNLVQFMRGNVLPRLGGDTKGSALERRLETCDDDSQAQHPA